MRTSINLLFFMDPLVFCNLFKMQLSPTGFRINTNLYVILYLGYANISMDIIMMMPYV